MIILERACSDAALSFTSCAMNGLNNAFFEWVDAHVLDNPSALRLKFSSAKHADLDYASAIVQIECRRKFASKFEEELNAFPRFYFPSMLAGEQASSDILAAYHASLLSEGLRLVDFTAGLGIDVFHLARNAKELVAIEMEHDRAEALRYNAAGLGLDHVCVKEGDCIEFIDDCIVQGRVFDAAFIDPARRDSTGKRVFALADCQPDVVALLPKISRICRKLIVKASPMLDISHTADALGKYLSRAVAVGTPTDCKELLLVLDFSNPSNEPEIEALVLAAEKKHSYRFLRSIENAMEMPVFGPVFKAGDYLYEAYPEVMKTGVFKLLAKDFGLSVIAPNTKLFYSDRIESAFPGHIYKVNEVLPYSSKIIKRIRKEKMKANVATRNFGIGADVLRNRLGISDGGTLRLYGFSDALGNKMLAIAESVVIS